jgi:rhodanese-related sulfurtransferase
MYKNIKMTELEHAMKNEKVHILDVREIDEFEEGHIPGSINTPISSFMKFVSKLDKTTHYYIVCLTGARSQAVAQYLGNNGYQVSNVLGGMIVYRGVIEE